MGHSDFLATPKPWVSKRVPCRCMCCPTGEIWYYHEDKYNCYKVAECWSEHDAEFICQIRNSDDDFCVSQLIGIYIHEHDITKLEDFDLQTQFMYDEDRIYIENLIHFHRINNEIC